MTGRRLARESDLLFSRIGQLPSAIALPSAVCGWPMLAASLIGVVGCADPPATEAGQRYDTAGVAVVVSRDPPTRRVLSAEPRASIGIASGDNEYMLYTVSGARLLDNGHIVVANCLPPLLRWYDMSGVYLMGAGNEGDGPNEFPKGACARDFQVFALSGARVETWEHSHRRLRVYDTSGSLVDARVLAGGSEMRGLQLLGKFGSGYLIGEYLGSTFAGPLSWRDTLVLHSWGGDGEHERILGRIAGFSFARAEVYTAIGPVTATVPVPFAPHGLAVPWGLAVAVSDGSNSEIRVLDQRGQLKTIIRWTARRLPVTNSLIEAHIDELLARETDDEQTSARDDERFRKSLRTYPYPDSARLYSAFLAGNDGLLWVRLFSRPGMSSVTWLGFAPSGSLTSIMDLPRAARLLDVGVGYVLVRVKDEFDVESVVLYGLGERRE